DTLSAEEAACETMVKHQIKCILPELNGEFPRLSKLCSEVAAGGKFRDVEMLLGLMLYMSEKPDNRDKKWLDLFSLASKYF
ncbi:MAG: hypothetical protein KGJ13_12635, partial [Patescibacteria group bacterium]|nr:hypothetical protein [Patescibacteria group bacterium]